MANKFFPKTSSYTTSIPFDQPTTYLGEHTISAATTFSAVETDAQVGYGSVLRLIADGTNTPDFSDFVIVGPGTWVNTAGTLNRVIFFFDGVDYCVSFLGGGTGSGGGGGDTTAPTLTSATIENATPNRIDLLYNEALDTGSTPATGNLGVLVDGVASNPITGVVVTGSTVQVTLTDDLVGGEAVLISYTGGTNKIQDVAGNDAATFSNQPVTNNVGGGGSLDSDAQAYITAIIADGASPTSGQQTAISDWVIARKAAGKWTDDLWIDIPIWGVAAANWRNLKAPVTTGTVGGGGSFSYTSAGAKPTGGTCYVDTGINPSTAFTNANNGTIAAYASESTIVNADEAMMGCSDSGTKQVVIFQEGVTIYGAMHAGYAGYALSAATSYDLLTRDADAANFKLYRGGVLQNTFSNAAVGLPNVNISLYTQRTESNGFLYPSTRRAWLHIINKSGFDDTEAATDASDVEDLKTGLGL